MNTSRLPQYLPWLDGLRGLAALAVVVFHYHHFYLATDLGRPDLPAVSDFPYAALLSPIYVYGSHAVELFWVISGFVFAHVYLKRDSGFLQFSLARFARLYPLHAATLLIVAGLQLSSMELTGHWQIYGNNDTRHFLLQLAFASNWSTYSRGLSFNGPVWSVSLEVLIYLVFYRAMRPLRTLGLPAAAAILAGAWAAHMFWPADMPLIAPGVARCGAFFFLGTLLNMIAARIGPGPRATVALFLACATAAVTGLWIGPADLAISGIAGALVLGSLVLDRRQFGHGRWLTRLGQASYSLYLVHVPIQMAVLLVADTLLGGTRAFADSHLTLPAYVVTSLVAATLAYRWLEVPAGAALRRRAGGLLRANDRASRA